MAKNRYKFNSKTLNYEHVKTPFWTVSLRVFGFLCAVGLFSLVVIKASYSIFDSPNEQVLKQKLQEQKIEIDRLEGRLNNLSATFNSLEKKDNDIYREIFGVPMPESMKAAGMGGSNRYDHLNKMAYGKSLADINKQLDELASRAKVQKTSYEELVKLAKQRSKKLSSIPAIMPVSNKDLTRLASGYGQRIDPFYKIPKFHSGMDFTAPTGTEVYATGDGVVEVVESKKWGYGQSIIINHGFGYKTRYAHLSQFKVKTGQKVTRGQIIGLVGNTGKSTGAHLHYEVLINNEAQNPANYYYSDLSDGQYEEMIELSNNPNQAFD
ncbi:MAG: peptidoglycan DD-metalloendopeptidase family protein [Flavobacteriales bacterium]|nr:peptidoglycan DD-metalloendopeptidase family protein [Flavobacteriales bacterium]